VGFGLSRVLIELNLMQGPWAYSIMVATVLTDIYLLYIFFTKRTASMRAQEVLTPAAPRDQSGEPDRAPFQIRKVADDPFHSFGNLLGFVIGMLGIAIIVYTIWPEAFPIVRFAR
jgi:hypothetical protein